MEALRELLIEQLQDILHAESQLIAALPKMANAAHNPKLKEAFAKHLVQTKGQVERLNNAFGILGEKAEPKPCKTMMGLVQEGEETIEDGKKEEEGIADLALIMAAQKVEHYEIAAYGVVRCLARQIGEREVETLLAHTPGEEESSDHMLTTIAKPILHDATQNAPFPPGSPAILKAMDPVLHKNPVPSSPSNLTKQTQFPICFFESMTCTARFAKVSLCVS